MRRLLVQATPPVILMAFLAGTWMCCAQMSNGRKGINPDMAQHVAHIIWTKAELTHVM